MLMKFSFFRTPFKHVPSVEGKEIDLYLLYWLVTAQGGFEKVSNFWKLKSAFCRHPTPITYAAFLASKTHVFCVSPAFATTISLIGVVVYSKC